MKVDLGTHGRWSLLTVEGRIDATTAPTLGGALRDPAGTGTGPLAVDLAGADYLSSAGLRVLLAAFKAVTGRGGEFALVGPRDTVREVLEVSGFLKIMRCVAGRGDLG